MHLPDYLDGSIVNVMASVEAAFVDGDRPTRTRPFRGLDSGLLRESRHVVLLVVDGLGAAQVDRLPGGALARWRSDVATSVFPSTTASAITSIMTGLPPGTHGLTGWHTWFREIGCVVAPLPFRSRFGADLRTLGVSASTLFPAGAIFDRMPVESFVVQPRDLTGSAYSTHHAGRATVVGFGGLEDLVDRLVEVSRGRDRSFTYAYWPKFDSIAHTHGSASARADAHLHEIDDAFAELADRLAGTGATLLVTADHGFIDTEPHHRLSLEDYPELGELLTLPLCGEARSALCYVRGGCGPEFEARAASLLGECADLVPAERALEEGWFGPRPWHPRVRDRTSDYILAMRDAYVLHDRLPGERAVEHIGVHGGVSRAEMEVPLIVVPGV